MPAIDPPVPRATSRTRFDDAAIGFTALTLMLSLQASYAAPLLLLAQWDGAVGDLARVAGWAFAWWGIGLYWLSGVLYLRQAAQLLRGKDVAPA